MHTVAGLSALNLERSILIEKDGGTRMAYVYDERLAPPCHYGKIDGFKDLYGRM